VFWFNGKNKLFLYFKMGKSLVANPNKFKIEITAQNDKEKVNQKNKLEIESTYKVIRLILHHLYILFQKWQ